MMVEYNLYLTAERGWENVSLALGELMFSILHVFLQAATISIFIVFDLPKFQGFHYVYLRVLLQLYACKYFKIITSRRTK